MKERAIWVRNPEENDDDYLFRLGGLKESGVLSYTWGQLTMVLNSFTPSLKHPLDESAWRKRYEKLKLKKAASAIAEELTSSVNSEASPFDIPMAQLAALLPDPADVPQTEKSEPMEQTETVEPKDDRTAMVQIRDERAALNRAIRNIARNDALLDLFKSEIHRYDSKQIPDIPAQPEKEHIRAVYALLSDIHYGISFKSVAGCYDSDIARERVMRYADSIIQIGKESNAGLCYVSILGDLISGMIHTVIRVENRENIVEQIVGVSELISDFLYRLSEAFDYVYVNAVSGNHSRLDPVAENVMRGERLDALIPWYCKTKLERIRNVIFVENAEDATLCSFEIFGKHYVSVHGDMDKDLTKSAHAFEQLCGHPVDYMIAGHLHVPNMVIQDRGYIRNGSVCGSGDNYTMSKRLFGNPCQIVMTVTEDGVESIWPVCLQGGAA